MAEIMSTETILNSSSTGAGSWFQLNPKLGNATFQVLTTGSSVGDVVAATVTIEASNDGVNPLATVLGTVTLSTNSPASDGIAINANWKYVRANQTSISASTGIKTSVFANGQVRS